VATPLAEAFVRVRADTSSFKNDVRRGFDDADSHGRGRRAGSDAGAGFSSGLSNALQGIGNVTGKLFDLLGSAAKWTAFAGGIAAVGAAAASSAGYLVAVAAAIAPVGGLLAALPGIALVGAGAFTVWKLATGGLGEAMGAALSGSAEALNAALNKLSESGRAFIYEFEKAIPLLKGFQEAAQSAFLDQIVGQLDRWLLALGGLKPAIRDLAAEFGGLVRTFLDFATAPRSIEQLDGVLRDTHSLVGAIHAALQPLLTGFLDLGAVGSSWLAGMSGGLQDVLTRFGEWMSRISESGEALAWMDGALVVLKQLGALVKDVWDIFSGLMDAARTAGGDVLGVLGGLVDGFAKWVNSAKGQEILVTVFRALNDIGAALLPVITALAGAIGVLAPIVAQLAELIGPILTTAITALAPAIAQLGPGAIAVFTALGVAVQTLADSGALTLIGQAFAALLIALAPLLPALADLLVPVLRGLAVLVTTAVAPALSTLVGWIQQAVNWIMSAALNDDHPLSRFAAFVTGTLVPAVQTAWGHLSTAFTQIVTWVNDNRATFEAWGVKIGEVVEIVKGIWGQVVALIGQVFTDIKTWIVENQETWLGWGDRIGSIATTLGQIVSGVFEFISIAWNMFGGPLLDLIGGLFTAVLQVVDGVMTALKGVIEAVLGVITGDWERAWNGVKDIFGGVWEAIKGVLSGVLEIIKFQISNALALVGDTWDGAWSKMEKVVHAVWDAITGWIGRKVDEAGDIINRLSQVPGLVSGWFGQVRQAIVDRFNDAVNWLRGVPGMITGALGNLGGLLYNAGRDLVLGFWNGIVSLWNWLVGEVQNLFGGLAGWAKSILGIASPSKVFAAIGKELPAGLAIGMDVGAPMVEAASKNLAATAVDAFPLPAITGPSPASEFGGTFGAPALTGTPVSGRAGGGVTIENLNVTVQGVLDPSNPMSYRRLIEQLREELRQLEQEGYANV
jgi:phage-related protein